MIKFKPGDKITILVNGQSYETYIDEHGVQRFPTDTVIDHLFNTGRLNLNQLACDYYNGKFDKDDYMKLNMDLGYSVCGFADLSSFGDYEIINPLWSEKDD
ncbi:hypothetical protein LCGC14_2599330 [marine sediment metagenome]|uniref:Uncharacterized protein n=1 Tax=marine sediment metagenome TaxID=412755 RepID=A0A0F9AWY5_9ZZZZ